MIMGGPRRLSAPSRAAGLALCAMSLWLSGGVAGCSLMRNSTEATPPAASTPTSVAGDPFAPAIPPAGYDPQRAEMNLGEMPGDPPAPSPSKRPVSPELPRQALKRLAEARMLIAHQRYAEAASAAEDALRYHPRHVEACRLAALACLLADNDKQARSHAKSGIEIKPDDAAFRYILARTAEKAEQFDLAVNEYRTALKCPVNDDDDYVTLSHGRFGLLLHSMGFYRAAVQQLTAFQKAVDALAGIEPANPELAKVLRDEQLSILLAKAEANEALKKYGPAADVLARVVSLDPNDATLRVRHIKNLVRAKRFNEAIDHATRHASITQGDLKAVQLLLDVYLAAGRQTQGLAAVKQMVDDRPERADLAMLHADALARAKRYDSAVQALNDVIARHPKQATAARWKLISIHRLQGNRQAWLWSLSDQLASAPTDTASALNELEQLPAREAVRIVDEALNEQASTAQTQPASTAARLYCLGKIAERLHRIDDARTLYDRALRAEPEFIPASIGMAESWIYSCQWDKGLAVLQAAEGTGSVWQASVNRLLGRCYDGLDDYTQAADHYRKAAELDSDDTESLLLLGRMLDRANRAKEARRVYERLTVSHPQLMEARELLVLNLLNHWTEGDNLKQMVAELKDMQAKAADDPLTIRLTAFVRLLMRQPPDFAEYTRILNTIIAAHPDDLGARRALITVLYRMRDLDTARKEAADLLAKVPCDAESHELICLVLMKQLDIPAAAHHLAQAVERYPNREMFLRNLAELKLVQQDYPAAVALWERALSLQTNVERHPAYRSRLVSTFLQAGWYDKLRLHAEQWLKDADKHQIPLLRSYLLAADAAEGTHQQYLDRCRTWLDRQPGDRQIREWLLGIGTLPGQAIGGLIGAGRIDEAVTQATTWVAQAPFESEPQQVLLQTLRAVRRGADLVEICRAHLAMAESPQQKLASYQLLADAYQVAQQYDEAIATLKSLAAELGQLGQQDVNFSLDQMTISLLAQAKRYKDAIAHANRMISDLDHRDARLQQLVAADPTDLARTMQVFKEQERLRQQKAEILRALSLVYTKSNQRDSAIDCLRQAIQLDPQDPGTNNDLGYSLADAGIALDEAEQMLKLAVSEVLWVGVGEDQRQAAFLDSLGWLYYKLGRFKEAANWLALGTKMPSGRDPLIHDHLGDTQWRLGQAQQAQRSWSLAIELHEAEVAEGKTDRDERLMEGIQRKLAEAARAGGRPAVATAAAD